MITVLLADDHAVLRAGLRALLNAEPDLHVVGEAGNGEEAVRLAEQHKPDVVVMDISMPVMDGLEATREITARLPQTRVLVLTMHAEEQYLLRVLEAGGSGYVLKRSAACRLIEALRSVAGGGIYVDPALGEAAGPRPRGSRPNPAASLLSERELHVLRRLAQGYSNKEIAAQLSLSARTVETYRARGMEKLGMTSRAMLMRYALEQGWLQRP